MWTVVGEVVDVDATVVVVMSAWSDEWSDGSVVDDVGAVEEVKPDEDSVSVVDADVVDADEVDPDVVETDVVDDDVAVEEVVVDDGSTRSGVADSMR